MGTGSSVEVMAGVHEVHFQLLLSSQENTRRLLLTMRSREERLGVISPRDVFIPAARGLDHIASFLTY